MAQTWIVQGTIHYQRDGYSPVVDYSDGSAITEADIAPEDIDELRRVGVLKTPGEVLTAEQVNQRLAEFDALKAEVEQLKAAQAAGMGGQRTQDLLDEAEAKAAAAKAGQ